MDSGIHLAIIPDGNRRWARNNGKSKKEGHKQGFDNAKQLVRDIDDGKYDIDEVSVWGLSRDNADKREQKEVDYLNRIFQRFTKMESEFLDRNVQFRLKGDFSKVQDKTIEKLKEMEENTEDNDGLVMNLLLGYDGKWDIVQASRRASHFEDSTISEEGIEEYLMIPEIDVVLGYGEDREHLSHLSNYQVGYATLYFPHINFPDASEEEVQEAIELHKERKKSRGA